jgi:hypothetical protein
MRALNGITQELHPTIDHNILQEASTIQLETIKTLQCTSTP